MRIIESNYSEGCECTGDGEPIISLSRMELADIRLRDSLAEQRFQRREAEHLNRKY